LSHHGLPGVIEPDIRRDVDRDASLFDDGEVFAERGPACWLAADKHRLRLKLAGARTGRGAFAKHLRGHALADFALTQAVFEQLRVGVRVHVDEAGGDNEAGSVDFFSGTAGQASSGTRSGTAG